MRTATPPTFEPEPMEPNYRAAEVASFLTVSRRTLDRWVAQGRFPAPDYWVNRFPVWRRSSIIGWLSRTNDGRRSA